LAMFSKDWSRSSTLNGKKARPPVSCAKYLRNLIAGGLDAGDVGRDGVDHHVGPSLRHFESLIAGVSGSGYRRHRLTITMARRELVPRLVLRELVAAGGSRWRHKARFHRRDAGREWRQSACLVSLTMVGYQLWPKCRSSPPWPCSEVGAHHAVDELARPASCSNLKRSRMLLLVVDQNAQAEGQVGLRREVGDGLPPLAFDDFKIVLDEGR